MDCLCCETVLSELNNFQIKMQIVLSLKMSFRNFSRFKIEGKSAQISTAKQNVFLAARKSTKNVCNLQVC